MAATKTRFSTADTKCMVRDIRSSLLGQRVANVYDLNDKTYMFKFAVPGQSEKVLLLLESGIRFHTTKYARDKSDMPSPFCMKLRRHIRTKRLEDVKQLCGDRIVDFKFGSGDSVNHIILELYANGNIVLTDGNYEVLALLRSHQFEEDVAIKVSEIYPVAFATSMDGLTVGSSGSSSDVTGKEGVVGMDVASFLRWAKEKDAESNAWATAANGTGGKKAKAAKKMTMRQLLLSRDGGLSAFGAEILDHCLLSSGVKSSTKVFEYLADATDESTGALLRELKQAPDLMKSLDVPGQPGYVIHDGVGSDPTPAAAVLAATAGGTEGKGGNEGKEVRAGTDLVDFVPRLYKQHEGRHHTSFPSFDEAVDEYYCKLEEQKLQQQASGAEAAAKKKVDKVRGEQEALIKSLEKQQRRMEEGAMLVELYHEDVDKCMLVINSALTAGMAWESIAEMVAAETAAGNPIASLVSRLRLDRNLVALRLVNLYDEDDDDDDDDEGDDDDGDDDGGGGNGNNARTKASQQAGKRPKAPKAPKTVEVEVDLAMSAHANARRMYGHKKSARVKEEKTLLQSERALQAVEEHTSKSLEAQKMKRNLQAMRKVHWFEKFNWFVTSEGYLVLSGRDAQQNEALVKRYLRPGDVYVHAELNGASSCIVRAKVSPDTGLVKPISPFALQEAGTMTCCRSVAWTNKVVSSAWWVFGSQVSKSAPTGEFLPTGSFMIYGRKNFLPPTPLEMGFGVMFRLDDASVVRHVGDRKDRSLMSDSESVFSEAANKYGIEFEGVGLRECDSGSEGGSDGEEEGRGGRLEAIAESAEGPETEEGDEGEEGVAGVGDDRGDEGDEGHEGGDDDAEEGGKGDKEGAKGTTGKAEGGAQGGVQGKGARGSLPDRQTKGGGGGGVGGGRDERGRGGGDGGGKKSDKQKGGRGGERSDKGDMGGARGGDKSGERADKGADRGADRGADKGADKTESAGKGAPKKKLSKKKARKYADQDDEDRELAMIALGHAQVGQRASDHLARQREEAKKEERVRKQHKAGVGLLKESWGQLMGLLTPGVRGEMEAMVTQGGVKESEIDSDEIKSLATFSEEHGMAIVKLFRDGDNLKKIGNKSGFLAGIMRRYRREVSGLPSSSSTQPVVTGSDDDGDDNDDADDDVAADGASADAGAGAGVGAVGSATTGEQPTDSETAPSRRDRKKQEQLEIQRMLEEEGILDEEEGKLADEVDKLTGKPLNEDVLLYAVPMCGPYSALANFKYKVKLTPGTGKKGKAVKQAVDVFTRTKECGPVEKQLMNALHDPEMVAIMIGDVKLSMPGLYQAQRAKKGKK